MTANFLKLIPLQVSATDFNMDSNVSVTDIIIGAVVVAIIIAGLAILNSSSKKGGGVPRKKSSGSGGGGGGGRGGFFSAFTVSRIARNIGLNHEQTRMLDFVFKNDQVAEPEKSINTPALLDRHFKRSYILIKNGKESPNEIQRKLAILFSTRNVLENTVFGGLTSTQQIKDDTVFTINYGRDKININLLSAKGDHLLLEAPKTVLGSQVKIPKGTKLNIMFFTKNNKGFSFETRVLGYATRDGHPALQLAHSNQLRFLSQRRYRRRQATIACTMNLVYVEGSGKKQRLIVDKRRFTGNITDISVGGCSIKMMSPVQVGARFKIEFTQDNQTVAALGQVLRSNRTGMGTVIHVRFLRVSQKSMNIVNSFVYEYGRE
ncbi:MAG: PilZ domain-containing protein [Treponema sp.]|nr:PilZ domain-containing protein [Treponema sp.]